MFNPGFVFKMPTIASKIPFFHEMEYEHVVERPQDDEESDKALLGDSSSSSFFGEYLLWCREQLQYTKRWLIAANIALFCLSLFLLSFSGFQAGQPTDNFNNTLIRQTSEHCTSFLHLLNDFGSLKDSTYLGSSSYPTYDCEKKRIVRVEGSTFDLSPRPEPRS